MKYNIFEYRDYKRFCVDWIAASPGGERGKRKELAAKINCQVSHISNVLSGGGHFSQEQAEMAARFMGLSHLETEFFLILIEYNRAGTPSLRKFYEQLIQEKCNAYFSLREQSNIKESLDELDQVSYYSSWLYGAIHVLLSIPRYQNRDALAEKLKVSIEVVDEVLSFLTKKNFCEKIGQRYKLLKPHLHLDKDSKLLPRHHVNWRLKTIQALDEYKDTDLHYSSVCTLSKGDFEKVKHLLAKSVGQSLDIIKKSPEEEMAVFCIDFYLI